MSSPASVSTGTHVHALLEGHCRHLVKLHTPVLEDRDPEPLHQMRVAMRRLRTCLAQFTPALDLPAAICDRRLAKSVRRLGMARDLDVLRQRLEGELLPQLPEAERRRLKPVLKQLRRERREAQEHLKAVLNSSRHLELIAALQGWLRQPHFSPLGEEPLGSWLLEWQWPYLGNLLLHPAWRIAQARHDGQVEQLHDLRKGIKTARYRLENLQPMAGASAQGWIEHLKQGQELLGDLNDLAVLADAIDAQLSEGLEQQLPRLQALLAQQHADGWLRWGQLAHRLVEPGERRRLVRGLLEEPPAATPG